MKEGSIIGDLSLKSKCFYNLIALDNNVLFLKIKTKTYK